MASSRPISGVEQEKCWHDYLMQKLETKLAILSSRDLLRYEEVNEEAVVHLTAKLLATGILDDPIICDPELGLLIDGHHRIEALRRLGIEMVPACTVSYLSDEVDIVSYYRFFSCTAGTLLGIVEEMVQQETGDRTGGNRESFRPAQQSDLVLHTRFGESEVVRVGNSIEASLLLHQIVQQVAVSGFDTLDSCSIDWDELPEPMQSCLYLSPPPSKEDIVTMAQRSGVFPPHVNKHVVDGIVFGIGMPLQALSGSKAEAENALRTLMAGARFRPLIRSWKCHDRTISVRYFQVESVGCKKSANL